MFISKKLSMRESGIEPEPHRWQRRILTTILLALISYEQKGFIKLYFNFFNRRFLSSLPVKLLAFSCGLSRCGR